MKALCPQEGMAMLPVIILISHMGGRTGVSGGGVGAVGTLQEEQLGDSREACLLSTQSANVHAPKHVHL